MCDASELCYIKGHCKPSMRTTVQVGNKGQTSTYYSLHVCLAKSTGHILSAYCNCKAGEAGLCAHVGGLLFSLVNIKNACTTKQCTWTEPRHIARKPSPKKVHEVRFTNPGSKEDKLRPYPDVFQAGPCKDPDVFLADLLIGLGLVNPNLCPTQNIKINSC